MLKINKSENFNITLFLIFKTATKKLKDINFYNIFKWRGLYSLFKLKKKKLEMFCKYIAIKLSLEL